MSAVPVQPTSLTEVMSHLLQIVTYLISEKGRGYKSRQVPQYKNCSPFDWKKDIFGQSDVKTVKNQICSFIRCHNMVDWRHQSFNQSVSQPVSQPGSRANPYYVMKQVHHCRNWDAMAFVYRDMGQAFHEHILHIFRNGWMDCRDAFHAALCLYCCVTDKT